MAPSGSDTAVSSLIHHTLTCVLRSGAGQSSQPEALQKGRVLVFFCLSLALITEASRKPHWGTH